MIGSDRRPLARVRRRTAAWCTVVALVTVAAGVAPANVAADASALQPGTSKSFDCKWWWEPGTVTSAYDQVPSGLPTGSGVGTVAYQHVILVRARQNPLLSAGPDFTTPGKTGCTVTMLGVPRGGLVTFDTVHIVTPMAEVLSSRPGYWSDLSRTDIGPTETLLDTINVRIARFTSANQDLLRAAVNGATLLGGEMAACATIATLYPVPEPATQAVMKATAIQCGMLGVVSGLLGAVGKQILDDPPDDNYTKAPQVVHPAFPAASFKHLPRAVARPLRQLLTLEAQRAGDMQALLDGVQRQYAAGLAGVPDLSGCFGIICDPGNTTVADAAWQLQDGQVTMFARQLAATVAPARRARQQLVAAWKKAHLPNPVLTRSAYRQARKQVGSVRNQLVRWGFHSALADSAAAVLARAPYARRSLLHVFSDRAWADVDHAIAMMPALVAGP